MIHQICRALYPRVGQLAYLLTIEPIPSSSIELLEELADEFCMDEIDKSVSDITCVEVVDRQVEEVYLKAMITTDLLPQHFF